MPETLSYLIRSFRIGERIKVVSNDVTIDGHCGKVIGFASSNPVMYIILLDEPLVASGFEGWTGVSLTGSMLKSLSAF